jgi:hypothetical protein
LLGLFAILYPPIMAVVEIFTTGTRDGETYDRSKLAEIQGNFYLLALGPCPFDMPTFRIGHEEGQSVL